MPVGMSIGYDAIQPADIIVSTTAAAVSGVIRRATFSRVSHSRLYIGNGEIIEAVGDGVRQTTLESSINEDTLTIAYRRRGITTAAAESIIRFAQQQIGRPYDYPGAASAAPKVTIGFVCLVSSSLCGFAAGGRAGNIIAPDAAFFCSELVARAFDANNLRIADMAAYRVNPDDVLTSHFLDYVGNLRGGD